jgi:hypothetical protein
LRNKVLTLKTIKNMNTTLIIALIVAVALALIVTPTNANRTTNVDCWTYFPTATQNLSEFNKELLSGTLSQKEDYKKLYEVIQRTKTIDVNQVVPYQCQSFDFPEGIKSDYAVGQVFLDDHRKFRLALDWRAVEERVDEYINNCLTLDEIEKKVPFARMIEQCQKEKESRLELSKIH